MNKKPKLKPLITNNLKNFSEQFSIRSRENSINQKTSIKSRDNNFVDKIIASMKKTNQEQNNNSKFHSNSNFQINDSNSKSLKRRSSIFAGMNVKKSNKVQGISFSNKNIYNITKRKSIGCPINTLENEIQLKKSNSYNFTFQSKRIFFNILIKLEKLSLTQPRKKTMEFEFNLKSSNNSIFPNNDQDEQSEIMRSQRKLQMFSDIYSIDSKFNIPYNFTPARFSNNFMESENLLISGGDPQEFNNNFIGKRENPFESDTFSNNNDQNLKQVKEEKSDSIFLELTNLKSCSFDLMLKFEDKKTNKKKNYFNNSSDCSKSNSLSKM
jgi:hypothetical protein